MASGIWTWSRFWTALPFTFETVRASMKASKGNALGVKHAITTIWGDEGNECDMYVSYLIPGDLRPLTRLSQLVGAARHSLFR